MGLLAAAIFGIYALPVAGAYLLLAGTTSDDKAYGFAMLIGGIALLSITGAI